MSQPLQVDLGRWPKDCLGNRFWSCSSDFCSLEFIRTNDVAIKASVMETSRFTIVNRFSVTYHAQPGHNCLLPFEWRMINKLLLFKNGERLTRVTKINLRMEKESQESQKSKEGRSRRACILLLRNPPAEEYELPTHSKYNTCETNHIVSTLLLHLFSPPCCIPSKSTWAFSPTNAWAIAFGVVALIFVHLHSFGQMMWPSRPLSRRHYDSR